MVDRVREVDYAHTQNLFNAFFMTVGLIHPVTPLCLKGQLIVERFSRGEKIHSPSETEYSCEGKKHPLSSTLKVVRWPRKGHRGAF